MEGKMIAGMYDLEETLGTGHFAVVKLARHVITGDHVAVKVIDKTKLDKQARDHLFQEVRCMKLVQHPSIIRLYQVIDTQSKLYLILELGENGDLYEYISKHSNGVGEEESRDLFHQIVAAISYCHRLHVVHRDLKPENVVFCQNAARVKLTDFGLSNLFAPGEKLKTSCGSLSYAAPEILLGDMYDAPAVDLWSLGVILYMLLVGEKPFVGGTDSETLTMIMDCRFEMPSHLSTESVDLVKKLLVSNPKERISLDNVLCHPWMLSYAGGSPCSSVTSMPGDIRTQLDDEDRRHVIQTMIDRSIADKEAIDRSLESNAYDHIAATYYLMAEAHLRKKEHIDHCSINHPDIERLDRRRQRVRKLSTPGSPARLGQDLLRNDKGEQPVASPKSHHTLQRPFAMLDACDSPVSPGRNLRRGAAETGVLRPARRTTMVAPHLHGGTPSNSPCTPDMPIGRSLRRSSLTCRLQSVRCDDNAGGVSGIGMLHFTLPLSSASSPITMLSPDEQVQSPPSNDITPPASLGGSGIPTARSLLQIQEGASVNDRAPPDPDSVDSTCVVDLTLGLAKLAGEPVAEALDLSHVSTPTRGGMYPNWLTGQTRSSRLSSGSATPVKGSDSGTGSSIASRSPKVPSQPIATTRSLTLNTDCGQEKRSNGIRSRRPMDPLAVSPSSSAGKMAQLRQSSVPGSNSCTPTSPVVVPLEVSSVPYNIDGSLDMFHSGDRCLYGGSNVGRGSNLRTTSGPPSTRASEPVAPTSEVRRASTTSVTQQAQPQLNWSRRRRYGEMAIGGGEQLAVTSASSHATLDDQLDDKMDTAYLSSTDESVSSVLSSITSGSVDMMDEGSGSVEQDEMVGAHRRKLPMDMDCSDGGGVGRIHMPGVEVAKVISMQRNCGDDASQACSVL